MVEASLKDAGCLSYTFFQNFLNKTEYMMVEKWENKEIFDQHLKTEHFAKLVEYVNKVSWKPMEIELIEEKEK